MTAVPAPRSSPSATPISTRRATNRTRTRAMPTEIIVKDDTTKAEELIGLFGLGRLLHSCRRHCDRGQPVVEFNSDADAVIGFHELTTPLGQKAPAPTIPAPPGMIGMGPIAGPAAAISAPVITTPRALHLHQRQQAGRDLYRPRPHRAGAGLGGRRQGQQRFGRQFPQAR